MPGKTRYWLLALLGLFLLFVLLDSLSAFNSKPWLEVPHGNHTHYVPKDCEPRLPVSSSPTRSPGPGETVDCEGNIVPLVGR